jgi:GNAT superfamily N-acetyltransferase
VCGDEALPAAETTFRLLSGTQSAERAAEFQALHIEVYASPPYEKVEDETEYARRFTVQCRQPGFALAEARSGEYLIGFAAGMPLRTSTSWWQNLTTPLTEELTAEPSGRTFALIELAVRASWRRQGIARVLHDLVLDARPEERATATVLPAATPAQRAFGSWGWQKVARTRDDRPDSPVLDVFLTSLPVSRSW